MQSDLGGINPSNDGKIIRLAIPQLTEERRKELNKLVKTNGGKKPKSTLQKSEKRKANDKSGKNAKK